MSRVGKNPIVISKDIKVDFSSGLVKVEGPKGKLEFKLPDGIQAVLEAEQIIVTRATESKRHRSLHGLARSLINNMVIGVSQGFSKQLEIIGVGFKAQIQGKNISMQVGYSHPAVFPIPEGITVELPNPTLIIVKGIDKFKVGQAAADIRILCPPEPYKGKGIRYVGEYVRRKAGKTVA